MRQRMPQPTLETIHANITRCNACERLRTYCKSIAETRKKAYLNERYWGKPITGFGDPRARMVIVGLAPAAHGANRTGRIFTGDRSGDWLYRALHRFGFANQPSSTHADDGLELKDCYISCVVKCAPPGNKPLPEELKRCTSFLEQELEAMKQARVYLALGQIALQGLWPLLQRKFKLADRGRPPFAHGSCYELSPGYWLLCSYHPSQQNTFTGKLTEKMFDSVFREVLARL